MYKANFNGKECAVRVCRDLEVEAKQKFNEFIEGSYLLRNVVHPNVVRFFDVFWLNENRFSVMVMELMNQSLTTYVQRSRIEISIKLSILHDVAAGLQYLHERKIVHQDLSPNNVLLKFTGNDGTLPVAKISDFGLAKLKYECANKQEGVEFSAIEAVEEKPMYDDTCIDVFSYASIVLFVINQQWPTPLGLPLNSEMWPTAKISEVERRQKYFDMMKEQVPALTELPRLAMACLSDDPVYRPSAEVLLEKVQVCGYIYYLCLW